MKPLPFRSKGKTKKGHHPWTDEEMEQWRKIFALGTEARTMVELGFYAGLRVLI